MKVLYVAPASPWPLTFGGSMRTAGVLAALERCAEVELMVIGDEPGAEARAWLAEREATLWTAQSEGAFRRALRIARAAVSGRSIPAARFFHGNMLTRLREVVLAARPDVVILGDTFLGEAAPSLRDLDCRIVIDTHNVESMLWGDVAAIATSPLSRAGYDLLSRNTLALERRALPSADRVWAASEEDAEWYRERLDLAKVDFVPNVVVAGAALEGEPDGKTVILSGTFAYPPNEDAALQLVAISRQLRARGVDHHVCLVGRLPTRAMFRAAAGHAQVEITGEVASIEPWMRRAAVFAAPLRAGSGTKFKLLQAMLAGRAMVTTPTGARGLGLEHGRHAWIVEVADFADALTTLLADSGLRSRLAAEARRHVLEHFTQASLDAAVGRALTALEREQ